MLQNDNIYQTCRILMYAHEYPILHNGRRNVFIGYQSDTEKIDHIEYRRNRNQRKTNQFLQLQTEEYDCSIYFPHY